MNVELIPLAGIALDGKTIQLGGSKADVERALGRPCPQRGRTDSAPNFSEDEWKALELLGGLDGPAAVLGGPEPPPDKAPLPEEPRWYYFGNELRIDFDNSGRVAFIELLGGPDGVLQPVIFGLPAFQEPPEAVVERLKEKNGGGFLDIEKGYSYTFKKLSVGLYRESVPENVQEMIEEAQADVYLFCRR